MPLLFAYFSHAYAHAVIKGSDTFQVILGPATHMFFDAPTEPDPLELGWYWATRYTDSRKIFGFMPDDLFLNADVTAMGSPINMTELCQNNGCPKTTKPANIIGKFGVTFEKIWIGVFCLSPLPYKFL